MNARDPFGIFLTYTDVALPKGFVKLDTAYMSNNLRYIHIPIFPKKYFVHRFVMNYLLGALRELEQNEEIRKYVKTCDGIWVPRHIGRDINRPLSNHSYGTAIDINARWNTSVSNQHPEVVRIFRRWGFRWGGDFHRPDPMHFEYVP